MNWTDFDGLSETPIGTNKRMCHTNTTLSAEMIRPKKFICQYRVQYRKN